MGSRKPIIGLCGGVGAGKSTVAREFERLGCLVLDSDRVNHEVLLQPEVTRTVAQWWGPAVLAPDGSPDRARIAELVFNHPEQKRRLESLVHPLIVLRHRDMIVRGIEDPAVRAIILDSPLLFESNLDCQCDVVIFVAADESRRVQRLKENRGWDAEGLRRREQWQLPLAEKRARSRFTIQNEGSVAQLHAQAADILEQIEAELPFNP